MGDKVEDKVRVKLSHYPIIYAFIGGTGIIIFWRGVWHSMDFIMELFFSSKDSMSSVGIFNLFWWDGPLSMLIGATLLLATGLFVSSFIGNEIVISGLKKEKKIVEKTEEDIALDLMENNRMINELQEVSARLKHVEEMLNK